MQIKDIEIKELIRTLEKNAFYGLEQSKVYLYNDNNIVELNGYIYEPSYESFSATHSIIMNGEILYAENARNVAPYENKIYTYGKFKSSEEAIKYIEEYFKDKDVILEYDKPNIKIKDNLNEDECDNEIEL